MNDLSIKALGYPFALSNALTKPFHPMRETAATSTVAPLSAMGIELEYMIVDRETLDVRPFTDQVFRDAAGDHVDDIDAGRYGWSKEVVRHVIEIKNPEPVASLDGIAAGMQVEIENMQARLATLDARLMPTAMHPWMDPATDSRIWDEPHNRINRAYASIFDLATHGWANLQSMHINIAFGSDDDFAAVHSAIRVLLPIIPGIAASSPYANGARTGFDDYRLEVYRTNASGFPTITGHIIPEVVRDRSAYEEHILAPMYRAIALHDPERILRFEWLNSRGAIARFDRNAIEIRVTDVQEAPHADIAIASLVVGAVRALHAQSLSQTAAQDALGSRHLAHILLDCARDGHRARIDDAAYLKLFGYPTDECSVSDLWKHISTLEPVVGEIDRSRSATACNFLLGHGTLASRIVQAAGAEPDRARLVEVYRELCECLAQGRSFDPGPRQAIP